MVLASPIACSRIVQAASLERHPTPFNIPTISGFGASAGFNFLLQDRSGSLSVERLGELSREFQEAARKRPEVGNIFTSFDPRYPQVKVELDREKARKLGVPVNEVFQALATSLGVAVPQLTVGLVNLLRVGSIAPDLLRHWRKPHWRDVRTLFKEGTGAWMGGWGWRLISATDGLVLAALGRPSAVAALACTSKLSSAMTQLSWPRRTTG